MRGLLRPALNTTVAAGLAGAVVLGGTTTAGPVASSSTQHEAASPIALSAAVTADSTRHHRHHGLTGNWRARVLRVAQHQAGDPYRYGAAGPGSFDCSGFTQYVFRKATGRHLPHNAAAQQGRTHRISARDARPGDLVFFHDGGHVYHVGIYVGHHTIIHAPYPGQRVKRERIWTSAVSYGRVR
jgi:cell wall-associated NlpC family hydrolase